MENGSRRFDGTYRWVSGVLTLWIGLPAFAQVPPRYVDALNKAKYTFFSGDVNSDGYPDVLAKATPRVIPITLDDLAVPIVTYPSSTFVLMSNGGSSYTLVTNPSGAIRNSPVWQANTHDASYGDIAGTGAGAMVIRARSPNGVSFSVLTSPTTGAPQLVQKFGPTDLGLDLGATGSSVQLRDTNRDSRADLVVRLNGIIVC